MELFIVALIIFLLAFAGLAIGIMFGRKGISGTCSSNVEGIDCLCGGETECVYETDPSNIVCAIKDAEKCQQILDEFEKRSKQRG
ncbi:MAG: hypothetical protein C0622_12375 [Desulfuromonas sp.]|nr:MAG: hypothetical protein C0622_12375 [Desulfuromonas sp.]